MARLHLAAGDTTATASAQTGSQYPYSIPLRADLAELPDWVEGVSTAAQQARDKGNITLAEALQNTALRSMRVTSRSDTTNRARQLMIKKLSTDDQLTPPDRVSQYDAPAAQDVQ
jgi:hypothetical protein